MQTSNKKRTQDRSPTEGTGSRKKSLPLLAQTRLFPPSLAGGSMRRQRLSDMPEIIRRKALTVVKAPAGYGKSTLLAQWYADLHGQDTVAGWVSLDLAPDDLVSFFHYVIAAVRISRPEFGGQSLDLLSQLKRPSASEASTAFVNGIMQEKSEVILFLDDAHLATDPDVVAALGHIVARPPANLHLVAATRHSLPFPLSGLRSRGQLAEISSDLLRFDHAETTDFLRAAGHETLTAPQIETLVDRTEGWAASIQLASIALNQHPDFGTLLPLLSGTHRHISEYLADDVLNNQPPSTVDFLLRTSILQRFCAELCDAVTGLDNAGEELHRLESQSLFLSSLDNERRWFRYHHLFARFLYRRLTDRDPAQAATLHQRASDWFAQRGMNEDAFNHAIEAGDMVRAAEILDKNCSTLMYSGGTSTLLRWHRQIPSAILQKYPRPRLDFAFSLILEWQFEEARIIIIDIDQCHIEDDTIRNILIHRKMMLYHFMDDTLRTDAVISEIGEQFPDSDPYLRGNIDTCRIYTNRQMFRLSGADKLDLRARQHYQRSGSIFVLVWHDTVMGPTYFQRGDSDQAVDSLQAAVKTAEAISGRSSVLTAMPALLLAEIHYECNDIDKADALVRKYGVEAEKQGFVDHLVAFHVTRLRLAVLRGESVEAARYLRLGQCLAERYDFVRLRHFLDHEEIRLAAAAHDLQRIKSFRTGLTAEDMERLSRPGNRSTTADEGLALAWCRACSALGDHPEAVTVLRRWALLLGNRGAVRSEVRMLALLSVVLARDGREGEALRTLRDALRKAESPRLVRSFVDEGAPMQALLRRMFEGTPQGAATAFGRRLLDLFPTADGQDPPVLAEDPDAPLLPEQFNARESEVMKLVAAGLSNKEIGNRLGLTEGVVKWYLQRAFEKLGVRRRSLAVLKARKFGII